MYSSNSKEANKNSKRLDLASLTKYIYYAREYVKPIITEEAAKVLKEKYV